MHVFFKIIITLIIILGGLFLLFSYLGACVSFAEKKGHDSIYGLSQGILFLCLIICFINCFINFFIQIYDSL